MLRKISLVALVAAVTAPAVYAQAVFVDNDSRHRTLTVSVGPLSLPTDVAYGGALVTVSEPLAIPINGWLRRFEIEVVDARGKRIAESLLHHAGLFAPNERELFSVAMRRIVAFGRETQAIGLPAELGYRVAPGDSILLLGALFNSTSTAFDSLYLRITMSYADATRDIRHADVLPVYLDVLPPGNREYDVPPGVSQRSWDWSPGIPGRILGLGGHLHRYGRAVILEDVTTGDTMWVGKAKYDAHGELIGVSRKIYWLGKKVEPTHIYRLTAIYDNPTDAVVRGAMGKIGGLFLPAKSMKLPPVDRSDPDYLRDYAAMMNHTHEMDHVRSTEQKVAADLSHKHN